MLRRVGLAWSAAALGAFWAPAPLGAQAPVVRTTGALDVGLASVAYDGYERAGVASLAPSLGLRRRNLELGLRGELSRFETGHMSAQGDATARWVTPAAGLLRGELAGDAGVLWYRDASPAVNDYLAVARLHLAGAAPAGAWLGGGAGNVVYDVGGSHGITRTEAGAWARAGALNVTAAAQRTATGDTKYTDVTLETRWRWRRTELTGSAGTRAGDVHTGARQWLEGSGTLRLTRRYSLAIGMGRYPPDAARGAPGGRYAARTMRVATARRLGTGREAVPRSYRAPPAQPPPIPVAEALAIEELHGDFARIAIDAPLAERVEIMGDFTDWEPLALTRDARGGWTVEVAVAPGIHRLNVRVDGGAWGVPPGMAHATDEFGGVAGVFVVR